MYFVFELYYKQTQKADNVVGVDASSENLAQFFLLINECCENVVIEFSTPICISFSQHSENKKETRNLSWESIKCCRT